MNYEPDAEKAGAMIQTKSSPSWRAEMMTELESEIAKEQRALDESLASPETQRLQSSSGMVGSRVGRGTTPQA